MGLTMIYKIINEMANVMNKEILISANTRTRYPSGTFCQNHYICVLHDGSKSFTFYSLYLF